MLHELLFALNGYDGDVFVLDKSTKLVKNGFSLCHVRNQVAANLPFIHPSEESLLNRICILATHYIKFKTYIDLTNNFKITNQSPYKKAFVQGLELVLEPYLKMLVNLEKELIKDPYITAAYIQCVTEEYQQLFPILSTIVDQVADDKVHGCEVLNLLYRSSITGVQFVRDNVLKILKCCHIVMYRQLLSWLLYGQLAAKKKREAQCEFFIQHCHGDGIVVKNGNEVEDNEETDRRERLLNQSYEVNITQLPSYLSIRVAQKILFIGQSVDLFRGNQEKGSHSMWEPYKESIMASKEKEFSRDVHELSNMETFDAIKFESCIDKIKTYVAQRLRSLMVDEADIQSNLRKFKDFFLIGRGELFLAFIDQSQHLLAKPPTHTTQHDINLSFQHAARDLSLDEKLYKQFQLIIQDPNSSQITTTTSSLSSSKFLQTRESGWNCLKMVAQVQWPLHIVFTHAVVQKYSSLFSFLLYVKRIQMELQHCWSLQMQQRHQLCNKVINNTNKNINSNSFDNDINNDNINTHQISSSATKWRLRNHMAFIIDNLQYYLQADVIESQFSILLNKIQSNMDFEEILLAHDVFLNSLLIQSFIHMKQVNYCLMGLLDLCHSYYGLVVHAQVQLTSTQQQQLEDISKAFHRQSSLLFAILSRIRNNPHLTQLLLRIDFNKFFSKSQFSSSAPTTSSDVPV